jgi:hypothetical protein
LFRRPFAPLKFAVVACYIGRKPPPFFSGFDLTGHFLAKGICMKRFTVCAILGTLIGLFGMSGNGAEPAAKEADQTAKPLRVGTFDSRAVALAFYRKFYRSPEFVAHMKKLKEEHDKAKAAGDQKGAKRLEAEGRGEQEQSHSQVFGSAPVDEIVAKIKDRLPEIAKQAGVDLVVSKWSITYRSSGAELVDVTEAMAKLFQPDEQTLKLIRELPKHPPLSAEELRKHGAD